MPPDISHHDAWRTAFHAAVARGHSPTMSAVIASQAFPDSIQTSRTAGPIDLVRCIRYGVTGFIILFVGYVGISL